MSSPSSSPAPVSRDSALAFAHALGSLSNDDNIKSQLTGLNAQAYRAARLAEGDGDSDSSDSGETEDRGQGSQSATSPGHQGDDDNGDDDDDGRQQRSSPIHVPDSQNSQKGISSSASHISVAKPLPAASTPSHSATTATTQPVVAPPVTATAPTAPTAASAATPSSSVPNLHDARMRYINASYTSPDTLIHAVVVDEHAVGTLTGLDERVVGDCCG
ncbi:hypothetical protein KC331_g1495 [Hortaea werneckii]|nr:hypothetical protein KC331_g1495 [Hortaea werneckii]